MTTTRSEPEGLLSIAELAAYLGVPTATVYQWSSLGTGPRSYKVGRHVRYRRDDVDAWLEARAMTPNRRG